MVFDVASGRRLAKIVLVTSVVAAAGLILVSSALQSFGYGRAQILLTFIGLIAGQAWVQLHRMNLEPPSVPLYRW